MSLEDSANEDEIKKGTGINPDEIEGILLEGIEKGQIELTGVKDGALAYTITQKGEDRVAELAGGKDVLEASGKFLKLLVVHGARGFPVESSVNQFQVISVLLQAFKTYGSWDNLLKHLDKGD